MPGIKSNTVFLSIKGLVTHRHIVQFSLILYFAVPVISRFDEVYMKNKVAMHRTRSSMNILST